MKLAPMPQTVKIGCHVYPILMTPAAQMPKDENGNRLLGNCDVDGPRIRLKRGQTRTKLREVLWHEVKHACTYPDHLGVTTTDEKLIDRVSAAEVGVMRDNPELMKFITT